MQEEVTGKSVALIISSAKMTEQVLDRAIRAYLDRKKQPKIYRGKQTLKQLACQNAGLSNIEITEKNIRCFTQTAKKYHVDFALKKDTTSEQPRYLVFFKSRDADAITAAFLEFTARKLHRKPSLRAQLAQAVKEAEMQPKPLEKELVKEKDRGVLR